MWALSHGSPWWTRVLGGASLVGRAGLLVARAAGELTLCCPPTPGPGRGNRVLEAPCSVLPSVDFSLYPVPVTNRHHECNSFCELGVSF